jgi:1,3-beta-galactosyl-N-acetylhexosamine phosphorylase
MNNAKDELTLSMKTKRAADVTKLTRTVTRPVINLESTQHCKLMRLIQSHQKKGFVTLPVESGKEKEVLMLAEQWGADAVRDSDGTMLSEGYLDLGYDVYSTICLVRADQKWAKENPDQLVQKYLISDPVTATDGHVTIDLLKGYFRRKYAVNTKHDPHTWWQVIDRTTGQAVSAVDWHFDSQKGEVHILRAEAFHVYTVSFLAYMIWDCVSMYNHLVNGWQIDPIQSVDPYLEKTYKHLMDYFDQWLARHPHTDVVRLTTLAYNFTLDSDETGADRYRDWLGYTDCVSPEILQDFECAKGYKLCPEDLVDQGYYNSTNRVPSQRYLDWMDFVQQFVIRFGRELVEKCHKAGKKAAIFWGDHWIGVEPYSARFQEMKIDINIGACEDGVALRRLADAPGPQTKEIRLYPYFFPDVFASGGNPLRESLSNWVKIRRALLRNCVDRIGYGGYTSLALKFPEFVQHVGDICDEFRTIKANSQQTKPYTADIKVYVLNAWGKLRSWLNNSTPDEKFKSARPDVTTIVGSNLLESLCGLPVHVEFISFSDIEKNGIPKDASVIINDGAANTSWSGGHWWTNETVVSSLRQWIHGGGGFVGVGDPTAHEYQGRFFQLADVLGVQKEIGQSMGVLSVSAHKCDRHFITEGLAGQFNAGLGKSYVYPACPDTTVLQADGDGHVWLASRSFGKGRSVYMAGLPFSLANARLLHRILFWVSGREEYILKAYCVNPNTECAIYPKTGCAVIVNNTDQAQETAFYDLQGDIHTISLSPYESRWLEL